MTTMLFKLSVKLQGIKLAKFRWTFEVTSISYALHSASGLITMNTVSCHLFYLAAFKTYMIKTCENCDCQAAFVFFWQPLYRPPLTVSLGLLFS